MGGGSSGIPIVGGFVDSATNVVKGEADTRDWVRIASVGMGAAGAGAPGAIGGTLVADTNDLYQDMTDAKRAASAQAKKNAETQARLELEAAQQAENQAAQDLQIQNREAARRRQRSSAGQGGRRSTLMSSPLAMLGGGMNMPNTRSILGS